MNKWIATAVLVLFATLGVCQDEYVESEGLSISAGVETFEIDTGRTVYNELTDETSKVFEKNVTVGIKAMFFSNKLFRQYPLYLGLAGNVTNVNGRNDSAYTIIGELGFQTNILTPFVALAYTNDLGEDGDDFNELDTDHFYIEDTNLGLGLMVNNPLEDRFSAKVVFNVFGEAGDASATSVDLYFRLQRSRSDDSAPVLSVGFKQKSETTIELRDGTERIRSDGSGGTLSVGMSIPF